jgi:hypothetical protein
MYTSSDAYITVKSPAVAEERSATVRSVATADRMIKLNRKYDVLTLLLNIDGMLRTRYTTHAKKAKSDSFWTSKRAYATTPTTMEPPPSGECNNRVAVGMTHVDPSSAGESGAESDDVTRSTTSTAFHTATCVQTARVGIFAAAKKLLLKILCKRYERTASADIIICSPMLRSHTGAWHDTHVFNGCAMVPIAAHKKKRPHCTTATSDGLVLITVCEWRCLKTTPATAITTTLSSAATTRKPTDVAVAMRGSGGHEDLANP